ncbi:hypothetical protein POTOM_034794 [Populus tomentosa]|uniref:Transducin/WD40 repeat-like superfamily protein n=1 Tax=Populus tomentosa TaxID=118781 RepID=A0A8X7Z364_POPTO|nr:hypothetical protein POTOM_034794 [Populus tomentosa]
MAEPIDNSNSNSNKEINNGSTESINENNSNNDKAKKLGQFAKPPKHSGKQWTMASIYESTLPFVRGGQLDFQPGVEILTTEKSSFKASNALVQGTCHLFYFSFHSNLRSINPSSTRRTSSSSTASDNDSLRRQGPEPGDSFVGMHCIFDQCKAAGISLRYQHTLLSCPFMFSDVSEPPSVIKKLEGHSKDVTDFDFSSNNQYIASAFMDKTVRVWELSKGICIRVIYGVSSQLCIRFHPYNDSSSYACRDVYTQQARTHTQVRCFGLIAIDCMVPEFLSASWRPSVADLVALEIEGYLTLSGSLKLAPRVHSISASFCPLLSLEKGEYIVAGSEDSNVYFYDLTRPKHTCVNKLQVHLSCILAFEVSLFHLHVLIIMSISDCRVIAFRLVMLRGTTGRICWLHLIFMASLLYGREKRQSQDRYKRKQFIHALDK